MTAPAQGKLAQAYREDGAWPDETMADAALRALAAAPERIIVTEGPHRLSTSALVTQAQALARVFIARGLRPGDVISIMLPNWHEATIIYLAASFAGLIANLILPNYRHSEVAFILDDCAAKMIFIPARFRNFDYAAMMREVNAGLAQAVEAVVLRGDAEGAAAFAGLMAQPQSTEALPRVDPDAIKLVMYTSGTSGRAKGVLHSHNTIAAAATQIARHWHVSEGDCFFIPSPISHIGGSLYAFELPFLAGTGAVLQETWAPDAAVEAFARHGCTHMAGATPFLQQLLAAARAAGTRLPGLKVFICGGASVPASLIREAAAHFENAIVSRVFGCTEVPMITAGAMAPCDLTHAAETDGKPALCEVKLSGPDGAAADEGEVLARGPQMLRGYLRVEDEEGRFDEEGYFRTGDLARLVDGEYLVITGRAKDIIIRNGENIAPKEIEDLLAEHPGVAEISIIGLPDARTGELACAVIVPAPGERPDVAALAVFLNARNVAKFKFPERVALRDALPRNAAGKVLKNVLREQMLAQGAS